MAGQGWSNGIDPIKLALTLAGDSSLGVNSMLQNIRTWFSRRSNARVRALAFTCSRHRPLMLCHCIMQLQRQSYPIDHAIYVNSPEDEDPDCTSVRYEVLLNDDCDNSEWVSKVMKHERSDERAA